MTNRRAERSGAEARRIAAEGSAGGRAGRARERWQVHAVQSNRKGGRAITSAIPGTTRDLNFARAKYGDREFVVVDSGGLELGGHERMTERIVTRGTRRGRRRGRGGVHPRRQGGLSEADAEALALVRETGCPLIMAVNKIDRPGQEAEASEFYALGGDELFFISAAHGRGVDELLDQVVARLPERESATAAASGFETRAGRPSQRRQVVDPQSPLRIRPRDCRRHSRHDARSGRRAADFAWPRRAVDRYRRNPRGRRGSKASSSIIRSAARSKRFGARTSCCW